jgi:hypothetical protein
MGRPYVPGRVRVIAAAIINSAFWLRGEETTIINVKQFDLSL